MSRKVYSRSGIGKERKCRVCKSKFVVGKTYFYCNEHSFIFQSKNWKKLTKSEQKLCTQYAWTHGGQEWYYSHLGYFLQHTKEWRNKSPSKKYTQKKRETDRYNNETLIYADNGGSRWSKDEIDFLSKNKAAFTAREIAKKLGRTYLAVITKACVEKIPLMTEDKKHMRLVTGQVR